MASGKTHMTVNVITGGVCILSANYFSVSLEPVVVGSILGTVITPDYDLMKNLPKSIISKIPILGFIWYYFWWPYAKMIKHRSFWSHSIIVSTMLRFLYLFTPLLLLYYMLYGLLLSNYEYTLIMLSVWCIQDLTHILLDKF